MSLVSDSLFYLNPGFQRQDEFLSGNVAMIPASVVSWAFMKEKPPFKMGVAPFPSGAIKTTVIAGTNIGMFKKPTQAQKNKVVDQLDFAKTEPKVKEWFPGRIYLNEVLEETVRLQRTPQEALDNAAQRLLIEIQ